MYKYLTPRSGLAMPVNDITVVKDGKVVPPGESGEVWLWAYVHRDR